MEQPVSCHLPTAFFQEKINYNPCTGLTNHTQLPRTFKFNVLSFAAIFSLKRDQFSCWASNFNFTAHLSNSQGPRQVSFAFKNLREKGKVPQQSRKSELLAQRQGVMSRFAHLEKFNLNFSSLSFAIRVNLLHS